MTEMGILELCPDASNPLLHNCQSKDMMGELGTVSDHSVNDASTNDHIPIPFIEQDHPLKHMEHRGIFDSGCSGHMTGNRAHLEDYQTNQSGICYFWRKKRRLGHLNFKNLNNLVKDNLVRGLPSKSFKNDHTCVACQKGKQHKASCSKEVIDIDVQTEEDADLMVVSSTEATRKAAISEKIATNKTHSPTKSSSTPISKSADDIMTFRKELDALALKHFRTIPATAPTVLNPLILDKYVADMLKKFDLVHVKAAITPMETKLPLTKDEEAFDVDVHLYRSMIGSLMYLTASRPDIMYAVCVCSRFQVTPKTSHLNAVKRIFKYLKGKPNLGLWYPRDSPLDLEAFSDSDYGGSNLDRKSTTGGCQFLGQRLISWQCKKQTIVATSTTEAEYVAAAHCCGQVLWVQNQLLDYGFNFMNTKIHIDNESTICIVKNPVYHSKTKHIEIRHHFIRDCYEKKLISVEKIHTDLNVADLYDLELKRVMQDQLGHGKEKCQVSLANWMQFGCQPQPSAAPTTTHHVSTPSSSHVQITQPQSPPPPITATSPPQPPSSLTQPVQPPPTITQSSLTTPQPHPMCFSTT
ncbi:putative ribonuclease H-like domain-containing protein [Tanacetum coccineum]|uniref:Ribonuclease H-like domain-containing protein n=1 Tax=Tanacetum coccineum TaxID=301880 RepID=A0ABQ5HU06_9ASTR